jgi:hypothetical protein
MYRIYKYLICSFLICVSAQGQEAPNIQIEFKVFGIGKDDYNGLYYKNKLEFIELDFERTRRSSETYAYTGPADLKFYVKNPDHQPADPESLPYIHINSCEVDPSVDYALIMFNADSANREVADLNRKFQTFALNDSPAYFKGNHVTVFNATRVALIGNIDNSLVRITPGISQAIELNASGKGGTSNVAFALETEDGVRLVMSNDFKFSSSQRVILILQPPRKKGSMRLSARMLVDDVY